MMPLKLPLMLPKSMLLLLLLLLVSTALPTALAVGASDTTRGERGTSIHPSLTTDTSKLEGLLGRIQAGQATKSLLANGLYSVNDVLLLSKDQLRAMKPPIKLGARNRVVAWLASPERKRLNTVMEIPIFSRDIESRMFEAGIKVEQLKTMEESLMKDFGMDLGMRNRMLNWRNFAKGNPNSNAQAGGAGGAGGAGRADAKSQPPGEADPLDDVDEWGDDEEF